MQISEHGSMDFKPEDIGEGAKEGQPAQADRPAEGDGKRQKQASSKRNAKKGDSQEEAEDEDKEVDKEVNKKADKDADKRADAGGNTDSGKESNQEGGKDKEKDKDLIPVRIEDWVNKIKQQIGLETSFDVQVREMTFGNYRTGLLFLSSFAKDTVLTDVLKRLTYLEPGNLSHNALESFFDYYLPTIQIRKCESFTEMINDVLMGNSAFYVDGEPRVLLMDAKMYPARNPEQPELEKVVRGSKDGFTETLLVNVALIRRRLRDPNLRFEILKVGDRTQTDVAIAYIDDIADQKLVESVRDKIKAVQIDGIPLADKQLEEMTVKTNWNPFPLVRYSERPDVVASHMMNGSVTIIVDTSPSVIVLPTTYFDLIQHAEENRQSPFIGTYLRWIRFFGIMASVFLMPLWYMYAETQSLRPSWLWFLGAEKTGDLPLVLQFLLVEIGIDLMRLAAVHTPSPLVTAMSLVSAILIGDIAVKTGLFINEVILYMAVAAIGMFATPSYELGLANRIVRLGLLLSVFLFQMPGFVVCSSVIFISLVLVRSYNTPYMWPFLPFNGPAMLNVLLRKPLPKNRQRPSMNRTKQSNKQPV